MKKTMFFVLILYTVQSLIRFLFLLKRKSDFRESYESVDTYLFGKKLSTASKTAHASWRYAARHFTPTKTDMGADLKGL